MGVFFKGGSLKACLRCEIYSRWVNTDLLLLHAQSELNAIHAVLYEMFPNPQLKEISDRVREKLKQKGEEAPALEQLIDDDLTLAFENLRFVTPDRKLRKYVAFAKRDFAEKIIPELKAKGLVSVGYNVPTRQCLRCLEGFFASGACPNPNCRSFDPQHRLPHAPDNDSCLIAHIFRNLPMTESSGDSPDQT